MPTDTSHFAEHGVSVVMPVHNGGQYLQAAVDSILNQQDVDLELLVIDDHSSDAAISSLRSDPRLKILKNVERGIVPALNTGLAAAKGYWLARMDGDDIAHPQRLSKQVSYLQANPAIDICGAQVQLFKDDGEIEQGYRFYQKWINQLTAPEDIAREFFVESPIPHPTALMRTSILKGLGGYQNPSWPEDYDLWCRALLAGLNFGKPQGVLLQWRDYEQRTSRRDDRYGKPEFLKCKAFYLHALLQKRGIQQCRIWGTGPTGAEMHDLLEQHGTKVLGFVDVNPKMKDQYKRGKAVTVISDAPDAEELAQCSDLAIIAVSTRGVRDIIRSALQTAGWQEGIEFIFVA